MDSMSWTDGVSEGQFKQVLDQGMFLSTFI